MKKIEKAKIEKAETKIIFSMLESEKKRSLATYKDYPNLEKAIVEIPLSRPNSLHIKEYLEKTLPQKLAFASEYTINIRIGRKGKRNSVQIDPKSKGKNIELIVAQLQTSYRRLADMRDLLVTLVSVFIKGVTYTDDKGIERNFKGALTLPSGAPKKDRGNLILKALGVSAFQGMDSTSIVTVFKCNKCGVTYTACNLPKASKGCFVSGCTGQLEGERVNYNHRSDNIGKHWGVSSEAILSGLVPYDPALKASRGKVRKLIFDSMGWEDNKEVKTEELEKALVETQTKNSGTVIKTMDRASKKAAMNRFIADLESKGYKLPKAKLKRFTRTALVDLAGLLSLDIDNKLNNTEYAMKLIALYNG